MDKQQRQLLVDYLRDYQGRSLRIMEVCGTHTAALYRTGLRQLLPKNIQLCSGPGCPVCVTPSAYIDELIRYAQRPGYRVLTFGDMLAVPGTRQSLAQARAEGAQVDYFYTPETVLELARQEQKTIFVLAAVGFETTAPVWAALVKQVWEEDIPNIRFLTALKTMPEAISTLCERGHIDGFLCPGHVAVITGTETMGKLAEKYAKPMVVGGFTGEELLAALTRLVLKASRNQVGLWNEYSSVVLKEGNPRAQELMAEVFEQGPAVWRGLGELPDSGLYLKGKYQKLDAGSRGLDHDQLPRGCQCHRVLLGELQSQECPCFGRSCTPEHPVGACMVSSEGSCCITYREGEWE